MPFPFDIWPWSRLSDLNVAYWIKKLEEISARAVANLETLEEWKTDTLHDLDTWKTQTLADVDAWESEVLTALELWKEDAQGDISDWESQTMSDLNAWKAAFIADYESLAARVEAIVSATEDMIENLAPPFSASTSYLLGDYVVQNGALYRFKADHPAGAWTGADAERRTAMQDIGDLSYDLLVNEYLTNSGEYQITKSILELGIWRLGNKQPYTNRGRVKRLIPVKAGMRLNFTVTDFDVFYGVATARTWSAYAQGGSNGTWVTALGDHSILITVDGYLVVLIRNHSDPTTDVVIANFNQSCYLSSALDQRTLRYFDASSLSSFGAGDLPANSFTYGPLAAAFTDCPADIAPDAYISIRKELENSPSVPTIFKITVRDVIKQVAYQATYRGGSSPLLWPWRKILTDQDFPETNLRTCRILKRVLCVGDSYTEGYINVLGSGAPHKEYSWPTYMEAITGNVWINCGVSGANSLTWMSSADGLAAAQAEGRVQAYIVQLMINDYNDLPVGNQGDIGTSSPTTYYGAYSKLIRELHAISPEAYIFTCTCPYLADKPSYQEAVRVISAAYESSYNVRLLDFKADQRLFRNVSLSDDLINYHYTALGYEQMAEIYAWYISNYINEHVADFQRVYSIPYDV